MKYLLDTNTCITHLRTSGKHLVSARIGATPPAEMGLPCIVVSELLYGGFRHADPIRSVKIAQSFCDKFKWVAFDERATEIHARIRAELESKNARIGPYDSIIAATALAYQLTLVTHNTREFERVHGLDLADWHIA